MFHEPHSRVSRPALLVVVSNHIFIVGIRVLSEITLDKISSLLMSESEQNMHLINVPRVQPYGMPGLNFRVPVCDELIWHMGRSSNLTGSCQTKKQEIQHKSIILDHKRSKLKTTYKAIRVRMTHVFVRQDDVVLCGDIICYVVVKDQSQKPTKGYQKKCNSEYIKSH